MKYTLADNAVSSLNIAVENFKKFFYYPGKYSRSKTDEAIKICLIFLENSIELMLKDILVSMNPLSIYEHPESRAIRNALSKMTGEKKLEDILIAEGNFKTITYTETVEKYNNAFHQSNKLYDVLKTLGERRNAITHFGIEDSTAGGELLISILNTFDIIYNYLYPQLIELDGIGDYFTSDNLVVETVHGKQPLFDPDTFVYNNIVDFLDELTETSEEVVRVFRVKNPASKLSEFTCLMEKVIADKKFMKLLRENNAQIDFSHCELNNNYFYFDITKDSELWVSISSHYSPYFNVTAFCGESGEIFFLVVHDTHKMYIYNQGRIVIWPAPHEPEPDKQWLLDLSNGYCQELNLSKRNLLLAFEHMLTVEIEE